MCTIIFNFTFIFSSKACQIEDWPAHQLQCKPNFLNVDTSVHKDTQKDDLWLNKKIDTDIVVKCNHKKYKIKVKNCGKACITTISKAIQIPSSQLKLIGKGKIVSEENIVDIIFKTNIKTFMVRYSL